jgi:hypothetical protein
MCEFIEVVGNAVGEGYFVAYFLDRGVNLGMGV